MTGGKKIKILCLTSHSPEGQDHGARLRARHLFRQLNEFAEVRVVLAGPFDRPASPTDPDPNPARPSEIFEFEPWNVHGLGNRLRYELGSTYLNTHGARAGESDCRRLKQLMETHDAVWVHGLRIANGFNLWNWPRTILDVDDIPSQYTRTLLDAARGPVAKLRAFRQLRLWKRHEARLFERFPAIAVCSEKDRAYFGDPARVFTIPNGFEAPAKPPVRRPHRPKRIGFIGSLEYAPNVRGLKWFLTEVWPGILQTAPDATLRVVGKHSDHPEWRAARNVEGLGWVEDADSEMATWSLAVVPIFEGGGTRIKISAAFSRKCPVVSTSLGAYGYEVANERELLLANSAPDFAAACLRLLRDEPLSVRLAETAWEQFIKKWTWEANTPRLEKAIQFVLGAGSNPMTRTHPEIVNAPVA